MNKKDEDRSQRQRIIKALLANPDIHYKDLADELGVRATYISQIKCDLRYRMGFPRGRGNYERPDHIPSEHCVTHITPWFVDMYGFPTRIATGMAVEGPTPLCRPRHKEPVAA